MWQTYGQCKNCPFCNKSLSKTKTPSNITHMAARHNAVDRYLEPHERIKKIVIGKKNIEEQENKLENVEIEEQVKTLEAEPLPSEPGAVLPEEPDVVLPEEPDVVLPEEPDDVLPANTAQYEILPSEYKEPLKSPIDGSISKKRHSCVLDVL